MPLLLSVNFNKNFAKFVAELPGDVYKAVMHTVAESVADVITQSSTSGRCSATVHDEKRLRVHSANILLYAVLNKNALIFINHRYF